jgi:DNA N-6-adenine-methyltransferase (Dam)
MINRLGPFDLDPCAADPRPWDCAKINWTSGSLERDWPRALFVYENPPFDRNQVARWVLKLSEHGNGICLLHARCETEWFQPIWQRAAAILFMRNRIKFCKVDGTEQPANSGAPPVIVAFGDEAVMRLHRCGIAGALVTRWARASGSFGAPAFVGRTGHFCGGASGTSMSQRASGYERKPDAVCGRATSRNATPQTAAQTRTPA